MKARLRAIAGGSGDLQPEEEIGMKTILGLLMSVAVIGAVPAIAQSTNPDEQKQNAPGAGGTSKPGVPGLPGSKSGPTATQSGPAPSTAHKDMTKSHDESKVPGLPGSKSGPAVNQPDSTGFPRDRDMERRPISPP